MSDRLVLKSNVRPPWWKPLKRRAHNRNLLVTMRLLNELWTDELQQGVVDAQVHAILYGHIHRDVEGNRMRHEP